MPGHRMALWVLGLTFLLSTEVWAQAASPAPEPARSSANEVSVGGGPAGFPSPTLLFGQVSWGSLPEKGAALRLVFMGTVWPDWHHDFVLVGTLDAVEKISQTKTVKCYVFGGPCVLILPFLRFSVDGGIGVSGILDAKHRTSFYGEARLAPVFGWGGYYALVMLSAGIKFGL